LAGVDIIDLEVGGAYREWPGLHPYEHGVRQLLLMVRSLKPGVCVFGGEYLMGSVARAMDGRAALMFNPEIFEDNERNGLVARFFLSEFSAFHHLIPISPLKCPSIYIEEFIQLLETVVIGATPSYRPPPVQTGSERPTVVIGNGGGVAFPDVTDSYSSDAVGPARWLLQTFEMTRAAIVCARASYPDADITVFSCLPPLQNKTLQDEFGVDARISIGGISLAFNRSLADASLVISRAGAGFTNEMKGLDVPLVIWPLQQHDEQLANARDLAASRDRTWIALDTEGLAAAVMASVDAEPSGLRCVASVRSDASMIVDRLLGV